MDTEQAAALTQAIQALANALANPPPLPAPPAAPAAPAPPAPTQVSPYKGGALDLASCTGMSLFQAGAEELEAKFTGKVDDLHLFLNNLRDRAHVCFWIGGAHDILTIQVGGQNLNLLEHYGQISAADVKTTRTAQIAAAAPLRPKQNAKMMYQCLTKSVSGDAKLKLATKTLISTKMARLFCSTSSTTCSPLRFQAHKLRSVFHPKRVKYDIPQVNSYICSVVKTLRSASTSTTTITDAKILYYQFKIYKRIKAPAEWTSKLLFLENMATSTPNYLPETLFNKVQSRHQTLIDLNLGRPSDRSPKEQAIAMAANKKEEQKGKNNQTRAKGDKNKKNEQKGSEKKRAPFLDKPGKEGDTKKWNNKTYYWCPANHRYYHWHTHKVDKCKTYKKWKADGEPKAPDNPSSPKADARVTINCNKLKKGMAALLPLGDYDLDDLADALASTISK